MREFTREHFGCTDNSHRHYPDKRWYDWPNDNPEMMATICFGVSLALLGLSNLMIIITQLLK